MAAGRAQDEVATAGRILAAAGHDDLIWGHVSVRDPAGRGVWMKESGWSLAEVDAEHVQLVDGDGLVLEGSGPRHAEYPIHTEIMAARADVGAVVHTHPPFAVALAAAGQTLRPVSHAATLFSPPDLPRCTATADLITTAELGHRVASTLGDAMAMFLVNHGIVVVGPDLHTATVRAVLLERACEQQLRTNAFGGWPTWSDDAEALAKRDHIYSPAAMEAVWSHLVRELDSTARKAVA